MNDTSFGEYLTTGPYRSWRAFTVRCQISTDCMVGIGMLEKAKLFGPGMLARGWKKALYTARVNQARSSLDPS